MDTSIQEQADAGIEVVNARLNYLADATPKPVNYAGEPPAGVPSRSGKYVEQQVAIRNGREVLCELSLDTSGFLLTPQARHPGVKVFQSAVERLHLANAAAQLAELH